MSTKKKILSAAAGEFAEKGYKGTTVRGICARARVNAASVNYHFKSKESLYREMFDFLFTETGWEDVFERPRGNSFEEWKSALRDWIGMMIRDMISANPLIQCKLKIFSREMQDPSEMFPDVFDTYLKPRMTGLVSHFRKALPPGTGESDIYIHVFSVIANCVFYFNSRVIVNMMFPDGKFTERNLDRIIDHSAARACAGINYEERGR
jgi:AcrR family transcriptional regulator